MRLSGPQLASLARSAGLPEGQVTTAVAVAYAENRGDLDAAKTIPSDLRGDVGIQTAKWGPSIGPWQIRSLKEPYLSRATGPDRYRDASKLTDPAYNATAMAALWRQYGWGPWSTYPAFSTLYLPTARAAVAGAPAAGSSPSPAGSAAGGASAVQPVGFLDDAAGLVGDAARSVVLPLNIFGDVGDTLGAAKAALGLFGRLVEFIVKAARWMADPHNWMRVVKVWAGSWLILLGALMFGWPALQPVASKAANLIPAGKVAKVAAAGRGAAAVKTAGAAA